MKKRRKIINHGMFKDSINWSGFIEAQALVSSFVDNKYSNKEIISGISTSPKRLVKRRYNNKPYKKRSDTDEY